MPLILLLAVALGGAIGAATRVGSLRSLHAMLPDLAHWADTLVINGLGCFAFGWLFIALEVRFRRDGRSPLREFRCANRLAHLPCIKAAHETSDPSLVDDLQYRGRVWSAFLLTGVLGAMTTFSAFSVDLFLQVWTQSWGEAVLNVSVTLAVTILAVLGGMEVGIRLAERQPS